MEVILASHASSPFFSLTLYLPPHQQRREMPSSLTRSIGLLYPTTLSDDLKVYSPSWRRAVNGKNMLKGMLMTLLGGLKFRTPLSLSSRRFLVPSRIRCLGMKELHLISTQVRSCFCVQSEGRVVVLRSMSKSHEEMPLSIQIAQIIPSWTSVPHPRPRKCQKKRRPVPQVHVFVRQ
jgi:hypothetical protein